MLLRYTLVSTSMLLACGVALAATPCEILTKGNAEYAAKRWDSALTIFRQVEAIDQVGKDSCTASIYATMGSVYTILGKDSVKEAPVSLDHYRNASRYHAAFANAVMCNKGNCKPSEDFWGQFQGFYK